MMANKQHALCQADRDNPEACVTASGIDNTTSLPAHNT